MYLQIFYYIVTQFKDFIGISNSITFAFIIIITYITISLTAFILKGVAIYQMANKKSINNSWLGFVPFLNFIILSKIVGNNYLFGKKVNNLGLFVCLSAFVYYSLGISYDIICYLMPIINIIETETITNIAFSGSLYTILMIIESLNYIALLGFAVLQVHLYMGLFRKYFTSGIFAITVLSIIFNVLGSIFIFVCSRKKEIDYEAYLRRRYQEMYNMQHNPYNYQNGNSNGQTNYYDCQETKTSKTNIEDEPFKEYSNKNTSESQKSGLKQDIFVEYSNKTDNNDNKNNN